MVVTIIQPGYLPWLGFFDLMANADCFVIYDSVDYNKNSWRNRNRIKTQDGSCWLTVPIITKGRFGQKIKDVAIDNNHSHWRSKHLKSIIQYYRKTSFFEQHISFFEELYNQQWNKLTDLNMAVIQYLAKAIGIKTKIIYSSSLNVDGRKTDRLVSICKVLDAKTYVSANGAKVYLEVSKFHNENIDVVFQDYKHPVYPQLYNNFIDHLSVIDLLFNVGNQSYDIIESGSTLRKENRLLSIQAK